MIFGGHAALPLATTEQTRGSQLEDSRSPRHRWVQERPMAGQQRATAATFMPTQDAARANQTEQQQNQSSRRKMVLL